ncbi:TPA: hypothetical protein ACGQST_004621 [Enterobacter kobei]
MARKFYDKEIKAIVKIIKTWSKPDFTWDSLCVACKKILGRVRISTLRNENETFSQLNSITYIGVFLRLVTYSHLP